MSAPTTSSSGYSGHRVWRTIATIGTSTVPAKRSRRGCSKLALIVDRLCAAVGVKIVARADRCQQLGIPAPDPGLKRVRPLRADLTQSTALTPRTAAWLQTQMIRFSEVGDSLNKDVQFCGARPNDSVSLGADVDGQANASAPPALG